MESLKQIYMHAGGGKWLKGAFDFSVFEETELVLTESAEHHP